ncbi:hypothetical protein FWF89_02070 [Candidatus Saccharibacteria bacterium]|nr:hypothetical protein [Candidatus Saccharibacteria bacterium]
MAEYETDGSSALAPNDPYNEMDRSDIRPNLGIIEGGGKGDGKPRGNLRALAQNGLSDAERSAANPISTIAGGADKAQSAEQNQSLSPRFTGKGLPGQKDNKKDGKKKGFFKGKGPLIAIMTLLIGGGGIMAGTQSLMPFSLIAQFQETFDSIKTVSELRSNVFFEHQLNPDLVKDPIRATMFGKLKFKITHRQETKLFKQGIEVERNFRYVDGNGNNKSITALTFDDGSGLPPMIIVPDAKMQVDVDNFILSGGLTDVDGSVIMPPVHSFNGAFDEIPDFRNGYIKGSRTWRGAVGAWFGRMTVRFLQSNRLTRDRFKNFQARVMAEEAGNTRSAAIALMRDDVNNQSEGVGVRNTDAGEQTTTVENSDGTTSTEVTPVAAAVPPDAGPTGFKAKLDAAIYKGNKAQIEAYLTDFGNGMAKQVSGAANAVVNVACTVFNFIGAVNLMLVAHEALQIMQLITGYFEAIQKVQAGDGADSPLNDLSNGLTTPANSTYETDDGGSVTLTGSAMASSGITSIYGNKPVNKHDPSVDSFNIGTRLQTILGLLGTSVTSFLGCAIAKAAASLVDLVLDVVEIVTCVGTFGIGCVVSAIKMAMTSVASSIAISTAISIAVPILAQVLFKAFSRDIISTLAGEDLGNAITSGANMYMGTNHRMGGGAPTNQDGLLQFIAAQQQVIANEARYQRETKSPFDVSSKYTFMGSLVTSIMSFTTQATSFTGIMAGIGNIVGSSISTILPSASALHAVKMVTSFGDCPDLESIGAVGDAFCNPYIVSDISTITGLDWDPGRVVDKVDDLNGLVKVEGEVPQVAKGSNLAKYIIFCGQRGSPFGVADQNIANDISSDSWTTVSTDVALVNTSANTTIGAIPVLGDFLDIARQYDQISNYGWVSGESCVQGGTTNPIAVASPSWDETRNYQRFVEDQVLSETIGLVEKSAVTAFLDDYYAEHPLDQSYEGILARKTGLTKETVIATFEQLEYFNFIANYDPTELYPMPNYLAHYVFSLADQLPAIIIADHYTNPIPYFVIYADTRTRSYAV